MFFNSTTLFLHIIALFTLNFILVILVKVFLLINANLAEKRIFWYGYFCKCCPFRTKISYIYKKVFCSYSFPNKWEIFLFHFSTLINNSTHYVTINYRNGIENATNVTMMKLNGCDYKCPLEDFIRYQITKFISYGCEVQKVNGSNDIFLSFNLFNGNWLLSFF